MAGIPALELAPTDRLPILHRDRGVQWACAGSSHLRQFPRFLETGPCDLKTPRPRFHWRHSSPPATCRQSRRRDAPDSKLENLRSAEWKTPASIASKNQAVAMSWGPGLARSRHIELGSTCSNNSIARAWNHL